MSRATHASVRQHGQQITDADREVFYAPPTLRLEDGNDDDDDVRLSPEPCTRVVTAKISITSANEVMFSPVSLCLFVC